MNEMEKDFLEEQLDANSDEAKELLEDEDKLERFLERLEQKLCKIPKVGEKLSSIPMLVSLTRAYAKKEYTDIPIASIISIVAGLIYFVSPIDLIPDGIPIVGYLDDVAVIDLVFTMIQDDIKEYEQWQEENGKRVLSD